ncbi:hypothetical protein RB195_003250 [Necator americanus]|uniref:Integrase zinc-binding domain-containing protein n=1 Tax=Necator americanus TaxID=51031 RepID=A0ABR1DQH4_NECAM
MNLRAFVTNHMDIMDAISTKDRSSNLCPKVLGIYGDSIADNFLLLINLPTIEFVSKRTVAQQIASIYDPLGWFIPLLVKAKRFQQLLWKEQYDWDEPLNEEYRRQWNLIITKISNSHKRVPRKVTLDNSAPYTLVTYFDASGIAMTACTYLISQRESSFLMAESKITDSNRPTTVPKLEINAITIGARLTLNTFLSLKSSISINNVIFLTDSEIVLNWLRGSLDHSKTRLYVKNRIREIRDIVQSLERMEVGVKFGYIDTKWNPADIGTRGASNHEFVSHVWWDGYSLEKILNYGFTSTLFSLVKDPELQNDDDDDENDILLNAEANVIKTHATTDKVEEILDLTRYNTKTKPLRILAYVIKFLRSITTRLKSPLQERLRDSLPYLVRQAEDQELTATDIFEAHSILIRNHQQVHLNSHYKKQLSKNLNLNEEENHVFRAYGRLNKSNLNIMAKNPILIISNTELCRLIILEAHRPYHNSTGHTIAEVRQQYWIPRLREQVKKCMRSCVPCQKMDNLPYRYPEMADLPSRRVTRTRPFENIGPDYFGPITVHDDHKERTNVYGCIFTCCVTSLIHLKIVSKLPTPKLCHRMQRTRVIPSCPQAEEYELCVNNYCIREKTPPLHKLLRLPPEEVLHDFEVNWKIRIGDSYTTVETACSALPFCSAIDCTMCAANILNPECWPLAAIAGLDIIIYLFTAICYTLCYIPVTVGRPFRIIIAGIGKVLDLVALFIWCCCQRITLWVLHRGKQQHRNRILQALAICSLLQGAVAYQEVNIFQHHLRNCRTTTGKSTCKVEVASVVKMNPFKKDVCISFQRNNSIVLRTRLRWEGLRLICDRIPVTYTRNVVQKIIDSKRCPHMGSCTGNKCADINTTSIVPELAIGNSFPGITGCMESCDGPGCDCFYLSSGCLFYRIYAVPTDDNVYELFKCIRWKEEMKLRLEISKGSTLRIYVLGLHPNIPNQIQSMDVTLSVLATPPLPALEQVFIASTNQTAIWDKKTYPLLSCPTRKHAITLQCHLRDDCDCVAAESQVRCICNEDRVGTNFFDITKVLPITHQQVRFTPHPLHGVIARADEDISTKIILILKESIDNSIREVRDDFCTVENTYLNGCYQCSKGATATVTCKSTFNNISAEVECGQDGFTIPCSPSGTSSKIGFLFQSARIQIQCSLKCGTKTSTFELTGILKYPYNFQGSFMHYIQSDHNRTSDFQWPDLNHILDIYLQWYKYLLITMISVAGALLMSYLYLPKVCTKATMICIKTIFKIIKYGWNILLCIFSVFLMQLIIPFRKGKKDKNNEKLL